jgi:hypothetical protein
MPRHSSRRYAQSPATTATAAATAQTTNTRKPRSSHSTLYAWLLSLLAVFLLGTVIVLSVVKVSLISFILQPDERLIGACLSVHLSVASMNYAHTDILTH